MSRFLAMPGAPASSIPSDARTVASGLRKVLRKNRHTFCEFSVQETIQIHTGADSGPAGMCQLSLGSFRAGLPVE
jgi:hypothetical protein